MRPARERGGARSRRRGVCGGRRRRYGHRLRRTLLLDHELKAGDFLFNASYDVSSLALIEYCSQRGILYLDACIEPWAGGHRDTSIPACTLLA